MLILQGASRTFALPCEPYKVKSMGGLITTLSILISREVAPTSRQIPPARVPQLSLRK